MKLKVEVDLDDCAEPTLEDKFKAMDIAHHRLIMYGALFPEVESYSAYEKQAYIDRVFEQVLAEILEKKRAKNLFTILTT